MPSQINMYNTGKPSEFGTLGYYDLLEWWNTEFDLNERLYISQKYKPMGGGGLTSGQVMGSSASAVNFLTGLQSWFTNLSDQAISQKILLKAEQIITEETPILDIHFLYLALLEHYYKNRKVNSKYFDLAKIYCVKQIEIATLTKPKFIEEFGFLPRHKGYEQLAIILENEYNYIEALSLSNQAKKEGWKSDWDKRILKLETKLIKLKNRC